MKLPFKKSHAGFSISSYKKSDQKALKTLMESVFWEAPIVTGQLGVMEKFRKKARNHNVLVARDNGKIVGFATVEFKNWNGLGKIHGLIVDASVRRQKIATKLLAEAEHFVKAHRGRGVHAAMPHDNAESRQFFEANQYIFDYQMTEYYGKGRHGVTYLKLLNEDLAEK